ncbi:MAG: hypothetical protein PHU45_02150 [Bacilli bacterium]|nr:hypothetical protein [Bacilli bacterium]
MENIINYYYNFYPETISRMYGGFYFENNNLKYLLVELITDSKKVLEIYELLMVNGIKNYIIIYNKDNNIITNHYDKNYILFIINCKINDILRFDDQFLIPVNKNINWSEMWSERINYYEIQINELAQDKKIVLHSVYYYIGLAENAIYIAGIYEDKVSSECGVQHYRMHVPITKGEYYNPNNMLVDVLVRDVAEYIKSSFFLEKRDNNYYIDYIKTLLLTDLTANLLLARLLYPSYYFDIFDDIILNDYSETELLSITDRQKDYEIFLNHIYMELSRNFNMVNINWLKKGL